MLAVATEEPVDMEQEGKAFKRATTAIGCDVNKPLLKVEICKSDCGFFNITQNNKYWQKKYFKISPIT